jgi:hypothetical protein
MTLKIQKKDLVGCTFKFADGKVIVSKGDKVVWKGTIEEFNKLT